jgi:DnaJ family protein A protein 2
LKEHPDKGGDPDKFKEITAAYDCLSDKGKREMYDRGGKEAA